MITTKIQAMISNCPSISRPPVVPAQHWPRLHRHMIIGHLLGGKKNVWWSCINAVPFMDCLTCFLFLNKPFWERQKGRNHPIKKTNSKNVLLKASTTQWRSNTPQARVSDSTNLARLSMIPQRINVSSEYSIMDLSMNEKLKVQWRRSEIWISFPTVFALPFTCPLLSSIMDHSDRVSVSLNEKLMVHEETTQKGLC